MGVERAARAIVVTECPADYLALKPDALAPLLRYIILRRLRNRRRPAPHRPELMTRRELRPHVVGAGRLPWLAELSCEYALVRAAHEVDLGTAGTDRTP